MEKHAGFIICYAGVDVALTPTTHTDTVPNINKQLHVYTSGYPN